MEKIRDSIADQLFSTDVPWYVREVPPLQPAMRQLLIEYAGVAPEDVEQRVLQARDAAWKAAPFPCVGSFLFAELALCTFPGYDALVARLQAGQRYLEVGCGLGQDVRKLLHSGAPPSALHATDLVPGLIAAGHALFADAAATAPLFLPGVDVLAAGPGSPLAPLEASFDIVHASMFLHCFDLAAQRRAAARIVALLAPRRGSVVVGRQGGVARGCGPREEAVRGPMGRLGGVRRTNCLHDEGSFREMWESVGRETGSRWEVRVETEEVGAGDRGGLYFAGEEHRWLRFEVVRVE